MQERVRHLSAYLDHVLAVVQHQKRLTAGQVRHDCIEHRSIRSAPNPEHGRDGMRHQLRVHQRRKRHQPDAVLERTDHAGRDAECEPSLAAATDAGERHQPPLALEHHVAQVGYILIASDELCAVGRQVVVLIPYLGQTSHRDPAVKVSPRVVLAKSRSALIHRRSR